MALIELQHVSKTYVLGQTRITALEDISLNFEPGEFTAVWGPSGSGKTTLLNLIGTLDEQSSGTLRISGEDVSKMNDNEKSRYRNSRIGFVFQTFNLIPVLSALENIMLPLQIRNLTVRAARKKAMERLEQVGLPHLAHNRPDIMSGGQRQRVAIARALVTDPELVIADEPTASLDFVTATGIIDIMQELNQAEKTTFLFSTHDQRLINRMKRLVRLEDGRLQAA